MAGFFSGPTGITGPVVHEATPGSAHHPQAESPAPFLMLNRLRNLLGHGILRDASSLTIAAWLAQALLIFRSYLIPASLGTEGFGQWRIATLILFYCTFTHLGTIEAFQREMPLLRGQGQFDRMRRVSDTTQGFWTLMSALGGVGLFLYAWLMRGQHDRQLTVSLYLIAPLLLLQATQYFLNARLSSEIRFRPVSISMLLHAVINVVLIVLFIKHINVFGALLALIAAYLITIIYLWRHVRGSFFPRIDPAMLRHLISFGLPITIYLALTNFLITFDQVMVGKFLGKEMMGIYGLSFSLLMVLSRVPNMISVAVEPRFLEYCGREGLSARAYTFITEQVRLLGLAVPYFAGLAALAVPPFLHHFLPDFVEAIPVIHVALIGYSIQSYTYPLKSMIILRKMQWRCVPILLAGLILCVGLVYAVLAHEGKLVTVAMASTTSYVIVSAAMLCYVLKEGFSSGEARASLAGFMGRLVMTFLFAALQIWLLLRWVRLPGEGRATDFATAALQGLIFTGIFGVFAVVRGRAIYRVLNTLSVKKTQ